MIRSNGMLSQYKEMYNSKGIKLVLRYLIDCYLFDLLNGVETHHMMKKSQMEVVSRNFTYAQPYMVSWTSTIRKAFSSLRDKTSLEGFVLVDIGCGKGKVCLETRRLKILGDNSNDYFGFDFERNLISVAQSNSLKMFGDRGKFIHADILTIDFCTLGKQLLIYMYNPFDEHILKLFLSKLVAEKIIIVYINPLYREVFLEKQYDLMICHQDWHANLCFDVYIK